MKQPMTYLALLIGLVVGWMIGHHCGSWAILARDHFQAKAGVFIDGYDRNKVYRITPMETAQ